MATLPTFIPGTPATIVARFAGALFGIEVGSTSMNSLSTAAGATAASQNAFLNAIYVNSVSALYSNAIVAQVIAANLGYTDAATAEAIGVTNYITAALNNTPYATRGETINGILNTYSSLSTATVVAWNAKVANALVYASNPANTASLPFNSISPTQGTTFTLTTGTDTLTGTAQDDTFLATAATTGPTFNAADTINGSTGNDTLNLTIDTSLTNTVSGATTSSIETINIRNVSGADQAIAAGNFAGATSFASDRSTNKIDLTGLTTGQSVGVVGNGSVANGAFNFTYGASVAAGTINISGGTTAGAITEFGAGITSNTINSTGTAKNTVGAIVVSGTADTALTINAAAALVTGGITGFTGTTSTITVAGAATNTASSSTTAGNAAVALGTIEVATVGTINASGLTAGGISAVLNANTAISVIGGAGNDFITTGSVLTSGSVVAGAGTGDRLTLNANADIVSVALGAKYTGFEVVSIGTGGTTLDLDNLAAANTLTGLRITGSTAGTGVTNINAATAANVQVTASDTITLGVKNALTPGQIDTLSVTVNDESATVNTITMTTPNIAGVEILNLVATDNVTITTLANALALTNLNVSGAGNVVTTLGAVALQTNYAINAGTATGNLTVDGTGATTNGFSVVGSSGINTITGGSQIISANLAASTAKADVIAVSNATGGTLALANATISGFTNSATVSIGDKIDVINTGSIGAAVTAAATTTDATITAGLSATGIFTFSGTGAAAATLAQKIAIATEAAYGGATQYRETAFEHNGNTYIVENGDAVAGFTAGTDVVIQLTGVTGITALSTTASGATTVWAV